MPHVFNDRDTIADDLARPAQQVGDHVRRVTISCISYGTPGTAYTTLPSPTGQHRPGAVPIGFGSGSPPSGTSAWRRLFCGMSRSRVRNIVAMCSASSMRRTSGTPISSAIASRVRSSWVGPIPPQMSTASARDEQVAQRLDDARLVVADHAVLVGVDARRGELLADPGTVGVDDLAEQQLRTDRKNFTSHGAETYREPVPTNEELGFPVGNPDERELLLSWLAYLRGAVVRNVEGLGDDEARWTPDGALISVLGVINHLTHVEWRWIDGGMLGHDVHRHESEFAPGPDLTVAAALAAYRTRAAATEATARSLPLSAPCRREPGTDLRWVLLHLINETARHAGHADATRELLDGTKGE